MKHTILFIILMAFLAPAAGAAQGTDPSQEENINARYEVERVTLSGVNESAISRALRTDMQSLVGRKYDQPAIDDLARRLREEAPTYEFDVKVSRGDMAEHVKVTFDARRRENRRFDAHASRLLYYSDEGVTADVAIGFDTHQNYFSVGLLSASDELVERNAGYRVRYENRRVGTDVVQVAVQFAEYHPSFDERVTSALPFSPGIPGAYRRRQDFAPSVSLLPIGSLKFTAGVSLQNLDFDVPAASSARAYAWVFGAQYREKVRSGSLRHEIVADYAVRRATRSLHGDLEYTRHLAGADYTLSKGRHLFGVHVQAGSVDASAPLFERFILGNSARLRGWNKFDVAPLGGSRLAYGSLEYRFRPFQLFYDVGSVWDAPHAADLKHAVGIGLVTRSGFFFSLGFPVRQHDVSPAVMFGVRY